MRKGVCIDDSLKNQAFTKIDHQEEKMKTEPRLRIIIDVVLTLLFCDTFTYPYSAVY